MTLPADLERSLRALLGSRLLTDELSRMVYECDGLTHFREVPAAVTLPETREEVRDIVRACAAAGVPMTPRGAGTGLSGGALPAPDGVLIDTSKMKGILLIDPIDRIAVVEPGVVNARLSEAAAEHGLFYAPDPSSQRVCTLGGNVAENAGGPHGLKYGSTAAHVLALEVVTEDGEFVEVGESSGLNLLAAFVGSEGTLGVVTRATLKLTPRPAAIATLLASFTDISTACRAVSAMIAEGLDASAIELLDDLTIAAVEASVFAAGYPTDAGAVLLVELDGHPADVEHDRARTIAIFERHDALSIASATDAEERLKLWRGRKGAFGAMGRVAPDIYVMDCVVPRTRLEEAIAGTVEICSRHDLKLANLAHAGDGNLHPNISYDGRDPDEVERVLAACGEIVRLCLDLGGALTGEHGIGVEKSRYVPLVFPPTTLAWFTALRDALSPRGLMNPGKLLPTPGACAEVGHSMRRVRDRVLESE